MKTTANLKLNKPDAEDFFSHEHMNQNMDVLDKILLQLSKGVLHRDEHGIYVDFDEPQQIETEDDITLTLGSVTNETNTIIELDNQDYSVEEIGQGSNYKYSYELIK